MILWNADQMEGRLNPSTLAELPETDSAGDTTIAVELTNTSPLACTVSGYGAFTVLDAQSQPLPTIQPDSTGSAESDVVTIQPDSTVSKSIEWTIFPNAPESGFYEASGIRVLPSGEGDTEQITMPWRLVAYCSAFNDGPFLPA